MSHWTVHFVFGDVRVLSIKVQETLASSPRGVDLEMLLDENV